jgi:hypothetical protein
MTVSSPPRLSDNRCVGLAGYRHRGEFLERGSAARARRETWVPTARCRRTAR